MSFLLLLKLYGVWFGAWLIGCVINTFSSARGLYAFGYLISSSEFSTHTQVLVASLAESRAACARAMICSVRADLMTEAADAVLRDDEPPAREPHGDGAVIFHAFGSKCRRVAFDARDAAALSNVRRWLAARCAILVRAVKLYLQTLLTERPNSKFVVTAAPRSIDLRRRDNSLRQRH